MIHLHVENADALKDAMLDKRITAKAKAVLMYAVIMGDGHDLTMPELEENLQEGPTAMRAAIRSLKNAGYIDRVYSSETGKFRWHWYFTVPAENVSAK